MMDGWMDDLSGAPKSTYCTSSKICRSGSYFFFLDFTYKLLIDLQELVKTTDDWGLVGKMEWGVLKNINYSLFSP